tara:strand:+ start:60 stop:260 length:201 start_codon:yes stop_codon:yes gene_type:complete
LNNASIFCSFYDQSPLLVIGSDVDMFEPGSIYEIEDFINNSRMLLKQLNSFFQIIDVLKLDEKTGL